MLTKDQKPEEKGGAKEAVQIIPPRPDTPEMFKAALKVSQQAGLEGAFTQLRRTYQSSESTDRQVRDLVSICQIQVLSEFVSVFQINE